MARIPIRLVAAMVSLAFAQQAFGADTSEEEDLALTYGDKTTISIVTGSQQTLRRAPAVASVITAADIAAMGATDLDDVLETVPGLHVNRGFSMNAPIFSIRGVFSQTGPQTLMLQNGIPMTTSFTGNKGSVWGGLPVENIARIEVIRGPGSALYGADAYSGVINIITKTAADVDGAELGVRDGSFHTRDGWAQYGGKVEGFDVAAYLRVGASDGFKSTVAADAQTATDKAFGTHASLAPGSINTGYDAIDADVDVGYGHWRWRASLKKRDNVGTGAGAGAALDPVGRGNSRRITTDLSWADPQLTRDWGAGFTASAYHYQEIWDPYLVILPPGTHLPTGTFPDGMIGAPNRWDRQLRLSAYATYGGFRGHNLRVGLGHDNLELYRTTEMKNFSFTKGGVPVPVGSVMDFTDIAPYMEPQQRHVNYAYVQDEWAVVKDWTLTGGVRRDHYSDFGDTTNPRLALVWDASYNLTAKLLYGKAFRAPAFNEEYSINNPVSRGNSDLKPERVSTKEVAVSWQARKDLSTTINFFHYNMSDIIRLLPNAIPGTGSTYYNIGAQTGRGWEFETAWTPSPSLKLTGNYAYQHSTDDATGSDAGLVPHRHLYGRAEWHFDEAWLATLQLDRVADRERIKGDTRPPTPDYTALDLMLRTQRGKGKWDFALIGRNITNADIREPSDRTAIVQDLPQAGRAWYLQASFSM